MTTLLNQVESPVFDCREAVRRLWDYLDRELAEVDVRAVEAHLRECDRCPNHFEFERAFLAAVRSAGAEGGASAMVRDRVSAILNLEPEALFD